MPYIKVTTNKPSAHKKTSADALRALVTQCLNKPSEFTLVEIQESFLSWGSRLDGESMGIVELRAVDLDFSKTKELSALLATWAETHLGIPSRNFFVNFLSLPGNHWGWNGGTF